MITILEMEQKNSKDSDNINLKEGKDKRITRYLSAFYIFPVLCESKKDFSLLYHYRNLGVYLGDTNKPQWGDKIVVAFKICAPPDFKKFFNESKYAYSRYYETIDDDKFYEILSFHIPKKYEKDIRFIINNEFTKTSVAYRNKVDFIASPPNSLDYFNNVDCIHEKLLKFNKAYLKLNLNNVNEKGCTLVHPYFLL